MPKSIREQAMDIVYRTIENAECASQYRLDIVDTEFKRALELNMRNEIEVLLLNASHSKSDGATNGKS